MDLKDLELNDTLHVMELAMPKGVEPVPKLKHENPSVVSVHVPKEIVVEEEAAAPVTEIIGEVPAEGEEAARKRQAEGREERACCGREEGSRRQKKEPAAAEKKEKGAGKDSATPAAQGPPRSRDVAGFFVQIRDPR